MMERKPGVRYVSTQEPLDEEERALMDPENWDWDDPIEGETVGEPRAIITLRLTIGEYGALETAARERGLPTADFIKRVALAVVRRLPEDGEAAERANLELLTSATVDENGEAERAPKRRPA
jgi:hypothetical protein